MICFETLKVYISDEMIKNIEKQSFSIYKAFTAF